MTKRDVVISALKFQRPPYVPWSVSLTQDCHARLAAHLGRTDPPSPIGATAGEGIEAWLDNHLLGVGEGNVRGASRQGDYVTDVYGVTWDRTVDRDIGTPCDWPIKHPADLAKYRWPDADDPAWYAGPREKLAAHRDRLGYYSLGFSLFERAWTMRGMENLLIDMIESPAFVEEFLDAIVQHNLAQVRHAIELGVDGVKFGDDYGMQTGLIMGIDCWRRFIKPRLARMFAPVRSAGLWIFMHSCGKVQQAFDDLVQIGLNMFNPFQPEVMDPVEMIRAYRGRLAFHGGMSIQKILPFGTVGDVRAETARLIAAGAEGGYVFSPSHAVPRDVPPENLVAMMEVLKAQAGYRAKQ
jgi:uroporphyrinogen decarboxylase